MNRNQEPLSDQSRRVLAVAHELAERSAHNFIGTAHLLFGLAQDEQNFPGQIFREAGIQIDQLEKRIRELSGIGEDVSDDPQLSSGAKKVLSSAVREAESHGDRLISPDHLLASLLRVEDGQWVGVLESLGTSKAQILDLVRASMQREAEGAHQQPGQLKAIREPTCPQDGVDLGTKFIAGFLTLQCPRCEGQFIRRDNFRRLYELIGVRTPRVLISTGSIDRSDVLSSVQCPDDAGKMLAKTYMDVTVYVCAECSGVWIKKGQLEVIWAKYEEGGGRGVSPIDREAEPATAKDVLELVPATLKLIEETIYEFAEWLMAFRRG